MARSIAPAPGAPEHRQHDEGNDHRPEDSRKRTAARTTALLLRLRRLRGVGLSLIGRQAHLIDDCIGARFDPAAIVGRVLFEMREDCFANDDAGHRVGHVSASAVARRDRNLMLVWRYDQKDALIAALLAQSPCSPQPIGVIIDGVALEAVDRRDCERLPGLGVQRLGLRLQVDQLLGTQQMRLVHHRRTVVRWKLLRRRGH